MAGEGAMNAEHRLPFETILVVTDTTHFGSSALGYAKKIADAHGSKLVVTHALDPARYAFPKHVPELAADNQKALHLFEQIEQGKRDHGAPLHSIVQTDVIYERIVQAARDHHANLLV